MLEWFWLVIRDFGRTEGEREGERERDGGEREGEEELGRVGGGGGQLLIKREGIKTDCGAG